MSNFDNIERIKEKLKQYQENSFISNDSKTVENSVKNNEFDDSSKFKSEELTGGSFENYYNKKFEDSPYYIKIKEIIEKIITSGYKPIFDCDWEIIRNFYNDNEEFNNGKSEKNYREDYIYYLDAEGKFNKKEIVSEYYQFMSERENKLNEVKYYSCSIDSILLETDYGAYRQKVSGNDVMIFTNMGMAMQYCDRDACSYAIRSKYKGEGLYKILCDLYKKVLNTPQRINDINKEKAEQKQKEIEKKQKEEYKQKEMEQKQKEAIEKQKQEELKRRWDVVKKKQNEIKIKIKIAPIIKESCVMVVVFQIFLFYLMNVLTSIAPIAKVVNNIDSTGKTLIYLLGFFFFIPILLDIIAIIRMDTSGFAQFFAMILNIIPCIALLLYRSISLGSLIHFMICVIIAIIQMCYAYNSARKLFQLKFADYTGY